MSPLFSSPLRYPRFPACKWDRDTDRNGNNETDWLMIVAEPFWYSPVFLCSLGIYIAICDRLNPTKLLIRKTASKATKWQTVVNDWTGDRLRTQARTTPGKNYHHHHQHRQQRQQQQQKQQQTVGKQKQRRQSATYTFRDMRKNTATIWETK